jgi:hypothetical protein
MTLNASWHRRPKVGLARAALARSKYTKARATRLLLEPLEDRITPSFTMDQSIPTLITNSGGTLAGNFFGNEPNIAVNPLNHANIVVAHVNTLAISLDGGATFPMEVASTLPAGFRNCGDDALAFDGANHLYWSYLECQQTGTPPKDTGKIQVKVQQVNPNTAALVGAAANVSGGIANSDDKPWIAADANPASPFAGNVYVVWTRFITIGMTTTSHIMFSRSTTAAGTGTINGFSAPSAISSETTFVWPSHVAVAGNGDVYVAYHENTCGSKNTTADQHIEVIRDTTGGATLQAGLPLGAGAHKSAFNAGVTCNVQASPAATNQVPFFSGWMQGSNAPYILPDPVRPGNVYIVYNSDPDGNFVVGAPGDVGAASVFLARSTDNGVTWSAFVPVSHAPAGVLSAFPNGSVDAAGNIVVFWYDTRGNSLIDPDGIVGNFDDRFALNLFASSSTDGGATFSNDFQVNDKNDFFDPVPGAPLRFDPDTTNPTPPDNSRMDADDTTRIGEYNGIAAVNGVAYVDWTGNSPDPPRSTPPATNATGQQIFFRQFDFVVKVTAPSNQSAVEGASQAITLGSFGDSSGGPWSVDVNWGDGTAHTIFTATTPGSLGTQNHTFAEEGNDTVTVTVRDMTEGDSDSASFKVAVSDPAVVPTSSVITPVEGQAFTLPVATFTDPGGPEPVGNYSAVINWGDGIGSFGMITLTGTTFTVNGTHTYVQESAADHAGSLPYHITVTIHHEATTPAVVGSIAAVADPAVIPTGVALTPVEGNSFTSAVATFTDPGGIETTGNYSANINWGDGTTPSLGTISRIGTIYTVRGTHTYVEESSASRPASNPYQIKVIIHHDAAPDANVTSTATVADAQLVATGDFNVRAIEEQQFNALVATFIDKNPLAPVNDFNVTIFWGDGQSSEGNVSRTGAGHFSVRGTHRYQEEGQFDIVVRIHDVGGSKATANSEAQVADNGDLAMIAALATANDTKKTNHWLGGG